MLNKLTKITAISALALVSQLGFAHSGHVKDSSGDYVKTSNGDCVMYTENTDARGCYPKPEPKPEPKPVAKPKPAPKPAPKPVPVVKPKPKPAPVLVQQSFSLSGDVLFATNSSELSSAGRTEINNVVREIQRTDGLNVSKIFVLGHADSRGRADYNQKLSEARAKSVADYMAVRGIDSSLIETAGAGESQPVASNDTAAGRSENRRVDISLSGVVTK